MSEAIEIRRFSTNYRLRQSQLDQRRRLDGLVPQVTDALELALEHAGVSSRELVCIRSIHLPVRLRLSSGDSTLVAEWAGLLATAAAEAVRDPSRAVRYGSRAIALIQMGADISQGRFHLLWAWRQAGFWQGSIETASASEAASEFAGALVREPELAVPILAALAARGWLGALARRWEDEWPRIALAVLADSGGLDETIAAEMNRSQRPELPQPVAHEIVVAPQVLGRASRIVERSQILAHCGAAARPYAVFLAAASLAILEIEPSLIRASGAEFVETLEAVRMKMVQAAPSSQAPEKRPNGPPAHSPERKAPGTRSTPAERPQPRLGEVETGHLPQDSLKSTESTPLEPTPEELQSAFRQESFTAFGGLLFLLHLENAAAIPERALASHDIAVRGLRWFQHRLALALQPLAPDDPAALAFCGLPPDAEHPSLDQAEPSLAEQEFVEACAAGIRSALAEALEEPAGDPSRLLEFVCRRPARIVADPGWIEVHLALSDVAIEIRRAGLDLDPNFVPWLGVVVRFVYE